jgi:AcrR family transcriptional regulator
MTTQHQRGGDVQSLTPRGWRKRSAIVAAAREVFEERGFDGAGIAEIMARVGSAYGSFYTYFDSREAVFAAVIEDASVEMFESMREADLPDGVSPEERVRRATEGYAATYVDHARLLLVLEQVASRDEAFRSLVVRVRRNFENRVARGTARLQERGYVAADVDPEMTALLLGSMIDSVLRRIVVLEPERIDEVPRVVEAVTGVWVRAIGLTKRPRKPTA